MVVRFSSGGADQDRTDRLFHALADPTRRDILRLVLEREQSVSMLAARYPMSFAAVQKHVAVLERAALVSKHRRGREQLVRGDIATFRVVSRVLDEYEEIWRSRVARMGEILADDLARSRASPRRSNKEKPR